MEAFAILGFVQNIVVQLPSFTAQSTNVNTDNNNSHHRSLLLHRLHVLMVTIQVLSSQLSVS